MLTQEAFLLQCASESTLIGVPLLVYRLRDLPQFSWKHGRDYAHDVEQRATAIFAECGATFLRDADYLIHDSGSEWYAVALNARGRSGRVATPIDARKTLTRMHTVLESHTQLAIDFGWTIIAESHAFETQLEVALVKGARERERYAFFSLIGHELRTPLTSIRGYLETVLDGELHAVDARRFIEIAYRESLRMGRLVESLYDISLLDLRSCETETQKCSLQAALEAALIATTAVRQQRSLKLSVKLDHDVAAAISEDALTQIFINLIDNAAKHGNCGGTVILSVSLEEERSIKVTIDDDGPGVNGDDYAGLFELGERGRTSAAGSGIGLGLVRLFLQRVGGEVTIARSMLGGASFSFCMPMACE